MVPKNFQEHAEGFFARESTVEKQLILAAEVRASIEIAHTSEYANWLQAYFQVFARILRENTPASDGSEKSKLRNVVYEILSRLPHNEVLRPYETQLLELALEPLRDECEKNALVCMRIAFDVHRNFRPKSEEKALQFLNFACDVFESVPKTVHEVFGDDVDEDAEMKDAEQTTTTAITKKKNSGRGGTQAQQAQQAAQKDAMKDEVSAEQQAAGAANDSAIIPALKSFKVCTECPLIIMLLFQLYPSISHKAVQDLMPHMTNASAARTAQTEFKESVKLRERFADLKSAQVKAISLITYLVRGRAELVAPYQKDISLAVVDLLRTCPDVVSTRKELLVATRHALSAQNFCRGFFEHLDTLLEEHALVGTGRLCDESLRPLAYSFLAELVHHMRSDLTLPQIRKIVHVFSTNMQDEQLPLSVQMTCARLLHHLVESIYHRRTEANAGSADEARALLVKILDATVTKFRTLRPRLKSLLKFVEHLNDEKKEPASPVSSSSFTEKEDGEKDGDGKQGTSNGIIIAEKRDEKDIVATDKKSSSKKKIPSTPAAKKKRGGVDDDDEDDAKVDEKEDDKEEKFDATDERYKELADVKAIVRTLFIGMKTLLWSITHFREHQAQTQAQAQMLLTTPLRPGLTEPELRRTAAFVKNGVKCLALYRGAECAEMCAHVAEVFATLDPRCFLDITCIRFDDLFNGMLELAPMVQLPHLLLQNQNLSRYFANCLAMLLVRDKLKHLEDPQSPPAQLVLKLFSLLLHAVSKYSNCEAMLSPYVIPIVEKCLKAMREIENPSAYVRLLRYLFRALAQAKFDLLYREVLPILPTCLDAMLKYLHGPDPHELHDTIVELCLTLPGRLSSILPHLPKLARPLCIALQSTTSELNLLGLRTLEFWVDSLNPDFLDPCIAEVETPLMIALWSMLKPQQSGSPFGAKAMQLLGKLGGRNRAFLKEPLELEAKENPEHGLRMILTFQPETSFLVPFDRCIALMRGILESPRVLPPMTASMNVPSNVEALIEHRNQALAFLRVCLASVINVSSGIAKELASTKNKDNKDAMVVDGENTEEDIEKTIRAAIDAAVLNGWTKSVDDATEDARQNDREANLRAAATLGNKTKTQLAAEERVMKSLIVAVVSAEADPELKKANNGFVESVAEHFAMLFIGDIVRVSSNQSTSTSERTKSSSSSEHASVTALKKIDAILFLDALVDTMECGQIVHVKAALAAMKTFVDTILLLSKEDCEDLKKAELKMYPKSNQIQIKKDSQSADMTHIDDESEAEEDEKSTKKQEPKVKKGRGTKAAKDDDNADATDDGDTDPTNVKELPVPDYVTRLHAKPPQKLAVLVDALIPRLCHCAFKTAWQSTTGAVEGIDMLLDSIPRNIIRPHMAKISLCLLRALRGLPKHAAPEIEKTSKVLYKLCDVCLPIGSVPRGENAEPGVEAGVNVIAEAVASTSDAQNVRPAVEKALINISRQCNIKIKDVLNISPARIAKILSRPLGSRHIEEQIQSVRVIDFCVKMEMHEPLIKQYPTQLLELFSDALLIAESETNIKMQLSGNLETMVSNGSEASVSLSSSSQTSVTTALRAACANLMSTLVTRKSVIKFSNSEDLQKAFDIATEKAVKVFFKTLTSKTPEIVEIAFSTLKVVVGQQSLSKELLQSSLRPILGTLGRPENLTLPLLAGLEKLLELLSNWFNPTLGDKLLEHLRLWLEPNARDPQIAAATVNLFHLLPNACRKFLEPLVMLNIQLENALSPIGVHSDVHSLYRKPLTKFLARYAKDTVDFYVARLDQPQHFNRFVETIRLNEGYNILWELEATYEKIFDNSFNKKYYLPSSSTPAQLAQAAAAGASNSEGRKPGERVEISPEERIARAKAMGLSGIGSGCDLASFNAIKLCCVMFKMMPNMSEKTRKGIRDALWKRWNDPGRLERLRREEMLSLPELLESKRLLKCFLRCVDRDRAGEVDLLFGVLPIMSTKTCVDLTFAREFITDRVAGSYEPDQKRAILEFFLSDFKSKFKARNKKDADEEQSANDANSLVENLKLVVLPMLTSSLEGCSKSPKKLEEARMIVTEDAVSSIVEDILEYTDDDSPAPIFFAEQFRVQLLQLATLLTRCLPDDLVKHKTKLIKFAWYHLKREDRASKQFAFVNICYFLQAFQAPEKIILQIFVALLRACQPDAKDLVKVALDALVPALPKRLSRGDHKYPIWIRYAKKILVEEGHSVLHLIHVWNLIVDHETHFYESRAQFVPQMVNSLSRLGLPSSTPIENRIVSINLVELILNWEDRRKDPAEFLAAKEAENVKFQDNEDKEMKDASDDEDDKSARNKDKATKKPTRGGGRLKKVEAIDDKGDEVDDEKEGDDEDDKETPDKKKPTVGKRTAGRRGASKKDDSEAEETPDKKTTAVTRGKRGRAAKKAGSEPEEEESEEEEEEKRSTRGGRAFKKAKKEPFPAPSARGARSARGKLTSTATKQNGNKPTRGSKRSAKSEDEEGEEEDEDDDEEEEDEEEEEEEEEVEEKKQSTSTKKEDEKIQAAMLKSAPSLITQPSLTGVAAGLASDDNEPEFSSSPAMAEITVNFLVRMAFLTGEGKDQVMKDLNTKTMKLLKRAMTTWKSARVKFTFIDKLLTLAEQAGQDSSSALGTGLVVFDLALQCEVEGFVEQNVNQIAQFIDPCISSSSAETHRMLARVVATAMTKKMRSPEDVIISEQKADGDQAAAAATNNTSLQLKSEEDNIEKKDIGDGAVVVKTEVKTEAMDTDAKLTTDSQGQLPAQVSASLLLSPEAKVLRLKIDETCAKRIGAAITGQPFLPNSQDKCPSLSGVLVLLVELGRECPEALDRYLPALIKLLSRLTQELNSASVAEQQQRVIQQQSSKSRSQSKDAEMTVPLAEYGSVAHCVAECVRAVASRVVAAGVIDHKQLFLRMLLQLVNDKGTHGAVLAAILDALCDWVDDATLGPYDPSRLYAVQATTTQGSQPAESIAASKTDEESVQVSKSATTKKRRIGSLSDKETVLFLSKMAQLTRMGLEATQTKEWENKLLGAIYKLCAPGGKHEENLRREVFAKVERQHLLGLRTRNPLFKDKFFQLYDVAIGQSLFLRLQYIVTIQEWDAMADTFWLMQGLDLILQLLTEDEKVTLAPNSGVVVGLFPDSEDPKMPPPGPPEEGKAPTSTKKGKKADSAAKDAPDQNDTIMELFARHAKFIKATGAIRVSDLVAPLRKVGKRNTHVAYYLWVLIFPIVWQTLQREEQLQLAKPMIGLLSKEYHQRQAAVRPNVIQALLEGISLSQPQPKIPSELIKFLGGKFNAWHISIALLENHVVRYPQENRCFDALAELYRLLDEGDVLVGLWRQRCAADITRAGLALAQHGHWQQAQDVFFQGMQNATSGNLSGVSKTEVCSWEAQWIQCAQQLNQWDLLADFAKSVNHGELQCHTSWRLNEWSTLKDILPPGHVSEVEETAEIMCVRAYSRLHAGRIRDAEQHWAAAVKRALDRWWGLPETGANCHVPMLHAFHVITEIQESKKVMHELANCTRPGHQNPQHSRTLVQDVLETWRLRTPNDWDPVPWHNQVLSWRGFMHEMIAGAQKSIQEVHPTIASQAGHSLDQLGMRDRAWAVNRFARIARKHNLPEVALSILSTQRPHVEVQEAFVKLSEQSRAYLDIENEAVSGLNALDSTSLEYFAPHHQAKLFHLRGQFQERLGDSDGAHESYATAVSLCAQLPEVWNTWGEYCQSRADRAEEENAMKTSNGGGNSDATENQAEFWTEQAATCVLQSIKHAPKDHGKRVVKIIHALGFSKHPVAVGRALQRHVDTIPLWVWIDWIPQLLLVLLRPEAPHAKAILTRLACAHPQAVYYQLRTFLLERRDALARKTQTYNQLESTPIPKDEEEKKNREISLKKAQSALAEARAVFEAAKETVDKLRAKFGNLVAEIEVLLSELCTRFGCAPEERLLVVVHTLLHRCFKYPCATTSEVPAPFKKELSGVAKACFSPDTSSKHADFVKEYKGAYEADLDPESKTAKDTFPKTLEQLIQKLKQWKRKLSEDVERRVPNCLRLEDELPKLRDVQFREIEVPGSHVSEVAALAASAASGSAAKDHAKARNRLVWVDSEVDVVRRHGNAHRAITFVGADGRQHRFAVQTSLTPQARSEERTLQLLQVLNSVMERHPQSRRRNLRFYVPTVIPAWPQVRLLEDDKNQGTYGEVYEANCARYGRDPDLPMELFKAALNPAVLGQVTGPEPVMELCLKAFMDIASQHVTENIFSQYMYKTLPNGAHLWTFKRQLCQQLALSSFVSALLRIGGRSPKKIAFAKNTGKVFMLDFYPNFDQNGMVEYSEAVPFRLTRNLHAFFTPFGVKGDFVATMAAAAQACAAPGRNVRMHLDVYFRDSLTIWPWRQQQQSLSFQNQSTANAAVTGNNDNDSKFFTEPDASTVNDMAKKNVEEAMQRLARTSPILTTKTLIPTSQGGNDAQQLQSVQKGVIHLVESALNPKNLARMDCSYNAWF